jgi:SAM-dependent methyltransferase
VNDYDTSYSATMDYFGQASAILMDHMTEIKPGGRVLDVGVGQGRNALALARAGFRVTGLDTSPEAIKQTRKAAEAENLKIDLLNIDYRDFETDEKFDAILVFGLIQTLSRQQCASLFHRIYTWSTRGSMLMLTAWHVDDPLYQEISELWNKAGLHSFRSSSGEYRTFLPRGVLNDIFLQWKILLFKEYQGPMHKHGDGPEHCHGNIDYVARRK